MGKLKLTSKGAILGRFIATCAATFFCYIGYHGVADQTIAVGRGRIVEGWSAVVFGLVLGSMGLAIVYAVVRSSIDER